MIPHAAFSKLPMLKYLNLGQCALTSLDNGTFVGISPKIETVMQETLFNPSQLLDKTVADTMAEVLVIRDSAGVIKKKVQVIKHNKCKNLMHHNFSIRIFENGSTKSCKTPSENLFFEKAF